MTNTNMLKRSKKKGTEPDNPMAITSRGNIFRRYWTITLVVILVPLISSIAYLALVRETAIRDQELQRAADGLARQQAAIVELLFRRIQLRLSVVANAPLTLAAVYSQQPADIALVEKTTLDYFPGILSLRLIALDELGVAGLEGSSLGLRNHIEVDLLRKTVAGKQNVPESYQFEGRWLTSMAELIQHPRDASKRAIILASFDNEIIGGALAAAGTDQGRSSLQQVFESGSFSRADEIATAGGGTVDKYIGNAILNEGTWTLTFTPTAATLKQRLLDNRPFFIAMAVLLLSVLIPMLALRMRFEKILHAEVKRITDAATKRDLLQLRLPQLLPLARQLRKTSLHQSLVASGKNKRKQAAPHQGDIPVPIFEQKNIDEEEEKPAEATASPTAASPPAAKPPKSGTPFPIHVFRAYDIRGLVPEELNQALVTGIGKALGTLAGTLEQQAVIVGCDGRESSPAIKKILVKALLETGRDVVDIGMVPTPLVYFANHTLGIKTGIMVTGSHDPPEYNGLKITMDGKPMAAEQLKQLAKQVLASKFSTGAGKLMKQDVSAKYMEAVVADIAIASPLKIVVDAGNGVAGNIAPRLLTQIGCEVIPLHCEIDGSFPNHHPDPSVDANLADLQAKVGSEKADFGVAFDGDGDRIGVVTAEGTVVRTDKLLMLYAQDVVSRNPGADVIFDVKCSRHLAQVVSQYGGRPILSKTGHSFIREKLQETGALLAGEFSGHIFFGERWFGFDDGMYAAARLAEIVSGSGTNLTELLSEFPQTQSTAEIRIPVPEDKKFEFMRLLIDTSDFSPGKTNTLDGIRVDYKDGWGLIRASNTVPALVARFEAEDTDALERIQRQFRQQLAKAAPKLEPGF